MLHALVKEKGFTLVKARLYEKILVKGSEDCWPWVGAADSYGRGRINIGGKVAVAPQVLLMVEGFEQPKAPNDQALHKSDCLPSCMNIKHLRWGSQKDNMQDKILRGTSRHAPGIFVGAKSNLTEQDIRDIRNSPLTLKELSKLYKLSTRSIWDIQKSRSWSWVT